jgi:hypothetical protein
MKKIIMTALIAQTLLISLSCNIVGKLTDKEKEQLKTKGDKPLSEVEPDAKVEIERILVKILKDDFDYEKAITKKAAENLELNVSFKTEDECELRIKNVKKEGVYAAGVMPKEQGGKGSDKKARVGTGAAQSESAPGRAEGGPGAPVESTSDRGPERVGTAPARETERVGGAATRGEAAPAGASSEEKDKNGKDKDAKDKDDKDEDDGDTVIEKHINKMRKGVDTHDAQIKKHFAKISVNKFNNCVEKMPDAYKEIIDNICSAKTKEEITAIKKRSSDKFKSDNNEKTDCAKLIDDYVDEVIRLTFKTEKGVMKEGQGSEKNAPKTGPGKSGEGGVGTGEPSEGRGGRGREESGRGPGS